MELAVRGGKRFEVLVIFNKPTETLDWNVMFTEQKGINGIAEIGHVRADG